jgi:hypothetical protein
MTTTELRLEADHFPAGFEITVARRHAIRRG